MDTYLAGGVTEKDLEDAGKISRQISKGIITPKEGTFKIVELVLNRALSIKEANGL